MRRTSAFAFLSSPKHLFLLEDHNGHGNGNGSKTARLRLSVFWYARTGIHLPEFNTFCSGA